MASIQVSKKYEGKQNKEIYAAAIAAIPNAGLQVWKKTRNRQFGDGHRQRGRPGNPL
jgi:hypothetical protein